VVDSTAFEFLMSKRTITPEQFADKQERHLLGTEGKWDWDDTMSIAIADERLERLRRGLCKFDQLTRTEEQEELRAIIAALRRSEFPNLVPSWPRSQPKETPGWGR
jgi:hypothetical protein